MLRRLRSVNNVSEYKKKDPLRIGERDREMGGGREGERDNCIRNGIDLCDLI